MSKRKIDRRDFLKGAAIASAGLAVGGGLLYGRRTLADLLAGDQGAIDRAIRDHKLGQVSDEDAQATVAAYMTEGGGVGKPRVVHVHDPDATFWNGETDFWNYVDQDLVNDMVDQGMMTLTSTSSVADAWQALLPNYQVGEGIAIKVNFNNSQVCGDIDDEIDALIQPVNAVVRGLKQMGAAEADIWVYDASRRIPDRFVAGNQYSGVQFWDKECRNIAWFWSNDPGATVIFSAPSDVPEPPVTKVTDVLVDATYVINMPIMKAHGIAGVTLGFKNHFGSIDQRHTLHDYIGLNWSYYRADYSVLVDIYQNPHIGGKTILTLGDGLFAAKVLDAAPVPWTTFGDQVPNSLFFATDLVAVDCIMCDFLAAEMAIPTGADDYLRLASDAGLGVFERGDPWGSGYSQIDYLTI
jgi:hypothetical protein